MANDQTIPDAAAETTPAKSFEELKTENAALRDHINAMQHQSEQPYYRQLSKSVRKAHGVAMQKAVDESHAIEDQMERDHPAEYEAYCSPAVGGP